MPTNWNRELSDEEIQDEVTLRSVISLSEACYMWGKSQKTLMMDYYRDRLNMRKSRGTWLVLARSAFQLYGSPVNSMMDWEIEENNN